MEVQNTLDRVSNYLELYNEVKVRVGDKDTALALIHEAAKDRRMDVIRQLERGKVNARPRANNDLATPKQIGFLIRILFVSSEAEFSLVALDSQGPAALFRFTGAVTFPRKRQWRIQRGGNGRQRLAAASYGTAPLAGRIQFNVYRANSPRQTAMMESGRADSRTRMSGLSKGHDAKG